MYTLAHKELSSTQGCTFNTSITHTDLHSIAVLQASSSQSLLAQAEDHIDSANQRFGLDPSRTIYVAHSSQGKDLYRVLPAFAEGLCVDYSLRLLESELVAPVSEHIAELNS